MSTKPDQPVLDEELACNDLMRFYPRPAAERIVAALVRRARRAPAPLAEAFAAAVKSRIEQAERDLSSNLYAATRARHPERYDRPLRAPIVTISAGPDLPPERKW